MSHPSRYRENQQLRLFYSNWKEWQPNMMNNGMKIDIHLAEVQRFKDLRAELAARREAFEQRFIDERESLERMDRELARQELDALVQIEALNTNQNGTLARIFDLFWKIRR